MKEIYSLRRRLTNDHEHVKLVRKASRDRKRKWAGLKETFGPYASKQWWQAWDDGTIPRVVKRGTISELVYAGMDTDQTPNSVMIKTHEESFLEGMYVNDEADKELYVVGGLVELVYGLLPLRNGEDHDCVFNVRISSGEANALG
ncbi:MAG: hypothetical protein NXH78_02020 [Hyphomonadaceae bacterium]|nr:hypothetical protein [Hyphomonadaceae bacterium]